MDGRSWGFSTSTSVLTQAAQLSCGTTCSVDFDLDTVVTLTATAATGSTFTSWSGSGCSGTGTCVATMSLARSVTANFTSL